MKKTLNLRQIEAFKAVIEHGTVNRAADALFVSQPAVSKLLLKLEQDTGLALFERVKGKLAPTPHGMRLYEEIDRIFAGLRQLEEAVDSIRRDEQRQLHIGVMPALSGSFVRRVTMAFIETHPDVHVSIQTRSSQFLAEWLVARQIDVALVGNRIENPYIDREPMISSPLFCALPLDHELARKRVIRATDLDGVPFISFAYGSQTDRLVRQAFSAVGARLTPVLDTVTAPTVCEFVAAGLGVSLVHPLFAEGVSKRVVLRRFEPEIEFTFQLCRVRASRNANLVEAFMSVARRVAQDVSNELLHGS
ncbi:LysR family transcriptional regulator [Allopusillimonas soli]|uniref:LysR family transcriptional regulator n=1 Tax=Allopusillimonas soli TaxID=659016 RepID=A0A853F7C1_9BURK|nr:LysR substrate-binding domain-containing protein [Allopusillimonas soli]NYT35869.1 LysR family transcriptional regulator [Allopusillimonas soli]TEA76234.1 LysR family transcriptional regulator [Allopusillimonas soli]